MTAASQPSTAHDAVTSIVTGYLTARGEAQRTTGHHGLPVDLGIGADIRASDEGLLAFGHRIASADRCLRHLLGPDDTAGIAAPFTYLADHRRVCEAYQSGYDPVLYRAYRDVLPSRDKRADGPAGLRVAHPAHAGPCGTCWHADLVIYSAGILPGGEPFRSIGHWNTPGQAEVFQTITGQTLLITASPAAGERPVIRWRQCGPGDVAVVPPGAWHLTYCLSGPAAVFNMYADLPAVASVASQTRAIGGHTGVHKYRTRPAPEIAIRWTADGPRLVGDADLVAAGAPDTSAPATWLEPTLSTGRTLSWFYLHASSADLTLAEKAAKADVLDSTGR